MHPDILAAAVWGETVDDGRQCVVQPVHGWHRTGLEADGPKKKCQSALELCPVFVPLDESGLLYKQIPAKTLRNRKWQAQQLL